jgi:hypothetical protein
VLLKEGIDKVSTKNIRLQTILTQSIFSSRQNLPDIKIQLPFLENKYFQYKFSNNARELLAKKISHPLHLGET